MLRLPAALFLAILVLAACGDRLDSKDKVHAAILERLDHSSGLDLKSLDVTTTSVTFDKNLAYATVSFHPKNDPSLKDNMTMKYTLEKRDGKWVVVSVADSQGHGIGARPGAGPAGELPAGHPPVDGSKAGATR